MKILVTGCAGFIGSHLVDKLLLGGNLVIGLDNFNDYYDPKRKQRNLKDALSHKNFKLVRGDILDEKLLGEIFNKNKFDIVVHLAARAGVRPSIYDPILYANVNKIGTLNLLNALVKNKVKKFIFASSSSVYGKTAVIPFREDDSCSSIISPYGASKKAAEFFVESFCKIYGLKSIILRFFTVYGPRGRPDMAPALFANAVINGTTIKQFGDGKTFRDYTFVEDIVDGIEKSIEKDLNFEIINLGNNNPVSLLEFISIIEAALGKKAKVLKLPLRPGDVKKTWANIEKARELLGWSPKTNISRGMKEYIKWLK